MDGIQAVALELIVQIRMRIDLQDRHHQYIDRSAQDRIGDRMIAAQRDERQPLDGQGPHRLLDHGACRQHQQRNHRITSRISGPTDCTSRSAHGLPAAGPAPPNDGRGIGRAPLERNAGVVRPADQCRPGGHAVNAAPRTARDTGGRARKVSGRRRSGAIQSRMSAARPARRSEPWSSGRGGDSGCRPLVLTGVPVDHNQKSTRQASCKGVRPARRDLRTRSHRWSSMSWPHRPPASPAATARGRCR